MEEKWECDEDIHKSLYEMCGDWMEYCPVRDKSLKELVDKL